jgi:predicted HicB family RNase H-like nuclease
MVPMDLRPHLDALRSDVEASAAVGGQELKDAAVLLAGALEASLRLRLLDLLNEAALELSGQMADGHVEVRLLGRDVQLVFTAEAAEPAAPADDDMTARISLRLPERLKEQAEAAAVREGISVNAWLIRTIARSVDRRPSGHRLRGFAQG